MANNEASDLIEKALNEAIQTMEDHDDGDLVVEWVLVAYVSNPVEEKGGGYPMLYSNGNLPDHRAKGLLTEGLDKLRIQDFVNTFMQDDDENGGGY